MMDGEKLLRDCYELLAEAGGEARPPYPEWIKRLGDNYELWPIRCNTDAGPRMVGFVLFKGHTIHIAVHRDWHGRWVRKSMLKAWRESYQHSCDLYATPSVDNAAAIELCERLGFSRSGVDNGHVIFVKEKTECQQPS